MSRTKIHLVVATLVASLFDRCRAPQRATNRSRASGARWSTRSHRWRDRRGKKPAASVSPPRDGRDGQGSASSIRPRARVAACVWQPSADRRGADDLQPHRRAVDGPGSIRGRNMSYFRDRHRVRLPGCRAERTRQAGIRSRSWSRRQECAAERLFRDGVRQRGRANRRRLPRLAGKTRHLTASSLPPRPCSFPSR